jgi:hypothetical protein
VLERQDVIDYTAKKQELQLVVETLFADMLEGLDLAAFLANPQEYTRAFLAIGAMDAIRAVVADANAAGEALAAKARG